MKRFLLLFALLAMPAMHAAARNVPPVPVITYSPEHPSFRVYDGETVTFDGSLSYDPDGYITSYSWSTATGSGTNSIFVYTFDIANGTTQTVELEVEDNAQLPAKKTLTFNVLPRMHRQYYVKDHLGSIRAVVDEAGNLVGYDDYYPFDLQMAGRSLNTGASSKEKYTGHELDSETGLLYAGAR